MQLFCALFHSIQAPIDSLQDFESMTEIPTTNLLEKEQS